MSISKLGGQKRVNTTTANEQSMPGIGHNPATGGFQVVWQSFGQDGFGWGVYGQNYDADGKKVGGEFLIPDLTGGQQEAPDVIFNEDGNGIWLWQTTSDVQLSASISTDPYTPPTETTFPAANYRVASKSFGFEETGDEIYLNLEVRREGGQDPNATGDDLIDISGISLGGDRFLTGWYSKDEPRDEFRYTVDLVRTNIDGQDNSGGISRGFAEPDGGTSWGDVALWRTIFDNRFGQLEEYLVVTAESGAADATGGQITFQIFQQNPIDDLAFKYDTRLETDYNDQYDVGAEGRTGTQSKPHIAMLDDGGFAITWQERDERSSSSSNWNYDIYVQVFNDDLTERTGRIKVHSSDDEDQKEPEIVALPDGGFLIAYNDYSSGDSDVYVQQFTAEGGKAGSAFRVNSSKNGDQKDVALDVLSNGNVAVTWSSDHDDANDVMLQILEVEAGVSEDDVYQGTNKNEKINTGAGNDTIDGAGGKDNIKGGDGDDDIKGGEGNDKIDGGKGDDKVDGGEGNDKVKGGKGADTFVYNGGKDKFRDFKAGEDILHIDGDLGDGVTMAMLEDIAKEKKGNLSFKFGKDKLTLQKVDDFASIEDDIFII